MTTTPLFAEAGRLGLAIPLAEFRARLGGEPNLRKILNALTVVEKVHAGKPRGMARITRHAYNVVRELGVETLYIPRIKGPLFLRATNSQRQPLLDGIRAAADALPAPRRLDPARCALEAPLYSYQEAAIEHLCGEEGPLGPAAIAQCRGVAYLQMDTGLGKTRVGCALIARLGEPALIVVPTEAIGDQWLDEFAEILPEMKVALYHNPPKSSRKVPPGPRTHDAIVIIVNTFRDKKPDFMEGFGTVVLDEAHEYHSTHNSRALWLSQTRAVLGLSATPEERPDGLDRYVHFHLGPAIAAKDVPGFDACAVNFRGEARIVEYTGHPDHCETATTPTGSMSAILTIGNIIRDPARMRLAAAEIERLYNLHLTAPPEELARLGLGPRPESAATPTHPAGEIRRHGVFVFAEHREYLPALRAAIRERMAQVEILAPELEDEDKKRASAATSRISILRGGVSHDEVGRTRKAGAHIVLTTYGFSRRGISLADMTAMVRTTPRRNGSRQILGRILRRGSDESIVRQVVDIVDVRTGLKGQVSERRKIYVEKKYPISKVVATWEEYSAPATPAAATTAAAATPAAADDEQAALESMALDDLLAAALGTAPEVPDVAALLER